MDKSKAIRNIIIYIVIIMTCMFLVGFFSGKKVYAAEGDDIYSDVPAPPLESNETYFLREDEHSSVKLQALVFDVNGKLYNLNVPIFYNSVNDSVAIHEVKIYEWIDNTWKFKAHNTEPSAFYVTRYVKYTNFEMLSVPIYIADENGLTNEVFFSPETHLSLFRLMAQIPMTEVTKEILSVMTISLGLVVSLVGLRKALRWLLTMLRKA